MKTKNFLSSYFSAWQQKFNHLISIYTGQLLSAVFLDVLKFKFHLWFILLLFFSLFLVPYIAKLFELFFDSMFILLNRFAKFLHNILPKIEQKAEEVEKIQKVEREPGYSSVSIVVASMVYMLVLSILNILNIIDIQKQATIIAVGLIPLVELVYVIIKLYYLKYKLKNH
jgi:hypothetical protein